jgi:hypothetical protein
MIWPVASNAESLFVAVNIYWNEVYGRKGNSTNVGDIGIDSFESGSRACSQFVHDKMFINTMI